ncbi:putative metallo-hydrolase [Nonomuraea coxensis DSM 45129]|uniref:Metallo-hydrolase n=1 Tax=Nonomuraea coxensis DSM 45129 TaxID=1122611 RepID=A0ABX8U3D8_9ACTN|nr:MBL fold metallo-hydrolase [Nonomuraea coxensis]QYC41158.1 putative metallo-hydrolase [Nonomuraea coxensis DSM 45129]
MDVLSFRTPGLGDQTYLLTHEGRGVLVDPQRDIGRFLDAAAERDVDLRLVLETHLHNDYLSGAGEAARRTGAELVMPAGAAPAYAHTPAFHLEDLDAGGGLTVRPVHTPGHTPEHTSYVVLLDGEPVAVFSGGSLLVATAGRTDLLGPERARSLARLQHASLRRLAALPPGTALYPTHGQGSFCTVSGAGRHTSTIGTELEDNPLLAVDDPEKFADALLAAPMPIPAFYRHMSPVNLLGVPPMPPVRVPELDRPAGHVVDVRPRDVQARGMLPGSYGIELDDDFGVWAGWLLPYGEAVTLVAEPGQDVTEAVVQLARVGFDDVRGVVRPPGAAGAQAYELARLPAFAARLRQPGAQLLDVRTAPERERVRIEGAVERFLPELFSGGVPDELDPDRPVLVACAGGRRAAIAAAELARRDRRAVALTGAGIAELAETLDAP